NLMVAFPDQEPARAFRHPDFVANPLRPAVAPRLCAGAMQRTACQRVAVAIQKFCRECFATGSAPAQERSFIMKRRYAVDMTCAINLQSDEKHIEVDARFQVEATATRRWSA